MGLNPGEGQQQSPLQLYAIYLDDAYSCLLMLSKTSSFP